jgi:hypothetical protein
MPLDPTKDGRYLRKSEREALERQRAEKDAKLEDRGRGKKTRSRDRSRDRDGELPGSECMVAWLPVRPPDCAVYGRNDHAWGKGGEPPRGGERDRLRDRGGEGVWHQNRDARDYYGRFHDDRQYASAWERQIGGGSRDARDWAEAPGWAGMYAADQGRERDRSGGVRGGDIGGYRRDIHGGHVQHAGGGKGFRV